MAFRQSQRAQQMFLPPTIEEFVAPDDPVRAYDAFVDALDWRSLGIESDPHQPGCPAYPPTIMLKILVYGYSYGIRSSRKLERALHHNLSFIWLAGGLKPDFKTIARFRRQNRKALKQVLRDCAQMRGRQGSHAGYNSQIVVDAQHGLIVQADVVSDQNDRQQFAPQIAAAAATTAKTPDVAGADNGYYRGEELEQMTAVATQVLVPARPPAAPSKPFAKGRFMYVAEENVYLCPAGQRLTYRRTCAERHCQEYQLDGGTCCACAHYQECTRGRNGRKIVRYFNEDLRDRLRQQFELPASRQVYRRRKETAELPFGHIKRNLGAGQFLLRGLAGVRAEMSLRASCFNVARLMGLWGVGGLRAKLAAL